VTPPIQLQVAVHDISRFEWRVILPLPADGALHYSVDAEFEVPASTASRSPWDQLHGFTRLEEARADTGDRATVDGVRNGVLVLAQKLRHAREGFWRHCRAVVDDSLGPRDVVVEPFLVTWFDAALASLALARLQLSRSSPDDPPEVVRERALADEFVSVRTSDMLAEMQAAVDATLRGLNADDERVAAAVTALDGRFSVALDQELAYRRTHRFPNADPDSPSSLEQYVERAGRLKKHFEAILALDRETRQLDSFVGPWVAAFVALIAGGAAFALQLVLEHASPGSRVGSGVAILILLAGAIYAARERLKEISRAWVTGRVYRLYAQRLVRCLVPTENSRARPVVVTAREWCNETRTSRPDPLNPASGAVQRTTLVNHIHKGVLRRQPELAAAGVRCIRQLFRYDLSPLFSQLQDPLKHVPVIDPATGRSRFVDAPRRYQIPIRVTVDAGGHKLATRATLFADKLGIARIQQQE
jgi:hypothetical protein